MQKMVKWCVNLNFCLNFFICLILLGNRTAVAENNSDLGVNEILELQPPRHFSLWKKTRVLKETPRL